MKRIRIMCLLILVSASVIGQEMKEGKNFPAFQGHDAAAIIAVLMEESE